MSLQTKILLAVVLVVGMYAGLDYAGQRFFVLPSFNSLERTETENSLRHCVGALKKEMSNLEEFTRELAESGSIPLFVRDRDDNNIRASRAIESYSQHNLNLIYVCDSESNVVWGEARYPESEEVLPLEDLPEDLWSLSHILLGHERAKKSKAGIFPSSRGPLLVASSPIIGSGSRAPFQRGTLVTGRFISSSAFRSLAGQSDRDFRLWPIGDGSMPAEEKEALVHLNGEGQFYIREVNEKLLHAYMLIFDLRGEPAFLMRAGLGRDIKSRAIVGLIRSNFLSNLSAGLIVLIVLWILLRVTVLHPISKLTRQVVAIGKGHNISMQSAVRRRDEIGTLAREFDKMFDKLSESRKRLFEQSYYLGKAEVASGILHNARNVLTPLVSRIDTLRQELRAAPLEHVEAAKAELMNDNAADSRREDLIKFVNLSNESLVALVQGTKAKVDDVASLIEQVEQMLEEQGKSSCSELPAEEIKLADVAKDSINSLEKDLFETIHIDIDASVSVMGPMVVNRISLLQVFNNILINAANSIRRLGSAQGKIWIGAEIEQTGDQDMVHIRIRDNGEGIEPEKTNRIFDRRFSTKQVPSGVGLHWCANTIATMRGKIFAESEGKGQGACLHILLPAVRQTKSSAKSKWR
ncbi:MAG: ATP-binding protein [Planctomycetota bacterium]